MSSPSPLPAQSRNLRDTISYWSVHADGFGGYTFKGPFYLRGRWEQKQQLFWNAKGEEKVSAAQVYLSDDVAIGGYIYLGKTDATDPTILSEAYIIRQFNRIPAISGTRMQRKVFL